MVTADENIRLSKLTENDGSDYRVHVPTNRKYNHLGINLYVRPEKVGNWKKADVSSASEIDMHFPPDLIEYEKDYLVA